jgi:DNA-binding response OmpR family regulator
MTRIVIADDDDDIRALVAIAVRRAGLEVIASCPDGNSAWSAIEETEPEIVLLDVAMPGHTGVELSRMIKSSAVRNPYIVLLSAAVSPRDREVGLDAGADEYLVKPFSPRELTARLVQIAGSLQP